MTKKQLLKRVKSLENILGFSHVPPDEKDDYDYHVMDDEWAFANLVKKALKMIEDNKKK